MPSRLSRILLVSAIASLLAAPHDLSAQETLDDTRLLDEATEARISTGLKLLAKNQTRRGFWLSRQDDHRVGVSALAALALLASGSTPERGPFSENLHRFLRALLDNQIDDIEIINGLFWDKSVGFESARPAHGHGYALLFLTQVCGEVREPALRKRIDTAIKAGISLSLRSQTPSGGWFYYPGDKRDEGSVTVTQIQALRAARNLGYAVPLEAITKATDYITASEDRLRGGIQYRLGQGNASVALSAAGITVLHSAGIYESEQLDRLYKFVDDGLDIHWRAEQQNYFYTQLYVALAMHQRGPTHFLRYYKSLRRELAHHQMDDGRWQSPDFGDNLATALALLILQIPREYLPIFQD